MYLYIDGTFIKFAQYDSTINMVFFTMQNGDLYRASMVPYEKWQQLVKAVDSGESAGAFFNRHFKGQHVMAKWNGTDDWKVV